MVCHISRAVIFILLISSTSCIVTTGYPQKYSGVPSFHYMKDIEINSYLNNHSGTYSMNNETKKQQIFDPEKDNSRRHIYSRLPYPIQDKQIQPLQSAGQDLSTSMLTVPIKNDLKPVVESVQESKFEEIKNQNTGGYFYDRPISWDKKIFKDDNKKSEYSSLDFTAAIVELNRLIQFIEKTKSYNSVLHLPTNPILALILSQYGKYTMTTPKYHLYSYASSNNVHNNQPFGQYKYTIDEA